MSPNEQSSPTPFHDPGVEYRRKLYARMSPEQRMERFQMMMERAWEILMSNPKAYEEFKRRNYHERGHRDPKKYKQPL
jgi:hypothetical protein